MIFRPYSTNRSDVTIRETKNSMTESKFLWFPANATLRQNFSDSEAIPPSSSETLRVNCKNALERKRSAKKMSWTSCFSSGESLGFPAGDRLSSMLPHHGNSTLNSHRRLPRSWICAIRVNASWKSTPVNRCDPRAARADKLHAFFRHAAIV